MGHICRPPSYAIETLSALMSFHQDTVQAPANSYQYRDDLMQVCTFTSYLTLYLLFPRKVSSTFSREDQVLISQALAQDESEIFEQLLDISASKVNEVLLLDGRDAETLWA